MEEKLNKWVIVGISVFLFILAGVDIYHLVRAPYDGTDWGSTPSRLYITQDLSDSIRKGDLLLKVNEKSVNISNVKTVLNNFETERSVNLEVFQPIESKKVTSTISTNDLLRQCHIRMKMQL